jgi:hypothetical protein
VKSPEHQAPSLEQLSAADKDTLILRLWRDLKDARARSRELEQALAQRDGEAAQNGPGAGPLLEKLQQADAAASQHLHRSAASPRLGWGRRLVQARVLVAAGTIVALIFALDFAVGCYQHYRVEQKRLADLKLQHAAYEGMFAEVVNVAYEPDGKAYRLTMKITNVEPGRALYVMQSPVRVFEQAGLSWKEVPSRDPDGRAARVVKLTDPYAFETIFEPNLAEWTELIPGYMHIRFESSALVSERSDPDNDLVDRTDRYYVYLKPHGADDEAIRKRMKYKGDPPVYMPMPPH